MKRLLMATAALAAVAQAAQAESYCYYSNPETGARIVCDTQSETCFVYDKDTKTWKQTGPHKINYLRPIATAPAPVPAPAYVPPPKVAPVPVLTLPTKAKTEIDGVMNTLSELLKEADGLGVRVKQIIDTKPEDAQKAVDDAASVLSNIADRAAPDSDLRKVLLNARNAALTHRQVVADMPVGMISEEGRTRALKAWDDVLKTADTATAGMADIHDQFLSVLKELRMRQSEIGELMLAEQYQGVMDSLVKWVTDLQTTVKQLHNVLNGNPAS